jgi:hypothetical protein
MLSYVFLAGILIFAISSAYFVLSGKNRAGLNSAFLVSFVTLISYVLMWQGNLTVLWSELYPAHDRDCAPQRDTGW